MRTGLSRTIAGLVCGTVLFPAFLAPAAHAQQDDVIVEPPSEPSAEPPPAVTIEVTQPSPPAPEADQARLGAWLEYLADKDRKERLTAGASTLIVSSGILAFGIWAFVRSPPNNDVNKGIGLLSIAAAGPGMAVGIVQLATKSASERRLTRWDEATAAGLTLRELGRFEGEFRHYSDAAKRERLRMRWTSFGLTMTGGLILGLTPAADLDSNAQTVGYITGGVALGVGVLGFAVSFRGSLEEEYWNSYLQGRPPPKGVRWGAAPAVGRKFAGARIFGQF